MNKETTITDQLPNKLSELILVALEDLQKIHNDPLYVIDADRWYSFQNGKCHACLAGAVIAKRMNPGEKFSVAPAFFTDEIMFKLNALDYVRQGEFYAAGVSMGLSKKDLEKLLKYKREVPPPPRLEDTELFCKWLEAVIDDLKGFGL